MERSAIIERICKIIKNKSITKLHDNYTDRFRRNEKTPQI